MAFSGRALWPIFAFSAIAGLNSGRMHARDADVGALQFVP
jgi:hypothetical protein